MESKFEVQLALESGRARRDRLLQKMQGTPQKPAKASLEASTPLPNKRATGTPAQTPGSEKPIRMSKTPGSAEPCSRALSMDEIPVQQDSKKRIDKATPIVTSPDLPTPGLKQHKHDKGQDVQAGKRQLFYDAGIACALSRLKHAALNDLRLKFVQ